MRSRLSFCALALLLCACGKVSDAAAPSAEPEKSPRVHYRISADAALQQLSFVVCAEGFLPERLEPPTPEAVTRLRNPRLIVASGELPLTPTTGALRVPAQPRRTCVAYAVDVQTDSAEFQVVRAGKDLFASPDVWLWDLQPRPATTRVTAEFRLPNALRAAVAWPMPAASGFQIPESTFAWKSGAAFGHFDFEKLQFAGGGLSVATLDGFSEPMQPIHEWLTRAASATADFYGKLPVSDTLVFVVPRKLKKHSFGMTMRGGGSTVALFLPSDSSNASLHKDWTAVHELFHLGVPRMPAEDAWFFEGLATYYTEVIRARAHFQSEQDALRELVAGFERGRRAGTGRSLQQESTAMHETHAYHRVYWAGGAIALMADVELRRLGRKSLDDAVRAFANCCAASEEDWSAERAIARFEAEIGSKALSGLVAQHLGSREFPDMAPLLAQLGVRVAPSGEVTLDDSTELASIRRAIFSNR